VRADGSTTTTTSTRSGQTTTTERDANGNLVSEDYYDPDDAETNKNDDDLRDPDYMQPDLSQTPRDPHGPAPNDPVPPELQSGGGTPDIEGIGRRHGSGPIINTNPDADPTVLSDEPVNPHGPAPVRPVNPNLDLGGGRPAGDGAFPGGVPSAHPPSNDPYAQGARDAHVHGESTGSGAGKRRTSSGVGAALALSLGALAATGAGVFLAQGGLNHPQQTFNNMIDAAQHPGDQNNQRRVDEPNGDAPKP
jgi:YD repeat-containing protein